MRKRTLISIVFLISAVLVVLLPVGMGYFAKGQMIHFIARYEKSEALSAELVSYKQGWLSSQVSARVTLDSSTLQKLYEKYAIESLDTSKPLTVIIELKISHLPFVMYTDLRGNYNIHGGRAFAIGEMIGKDGVPILHFQMRDHFNGNIVFRYNSPAYEIVNKQQRISWRNVFGYWEMSSHAKQISARFNADAIEFQSPDLKLELLNPEFQGKRQLVQKGLWLGSTRLRIPMAYLSNENHYSLFAQDFAVSASQALQNKVVNTSFEGHFYKLTFKGAEYGPGDWQLVMKNLDAAYLSDVTMLMKHLMFKPREQWNINPKTIAVQEKALAALLSRGLKVQLQSLDIQTPAGKCSLQAWLTLPNIHNDPYKSLPKLYSGAEGSFLLTIPQKTLSRVLVLMLKNTYEKRGIPEKDLQQAKSVGIDFLAENNAQKMVNTWLRDRWLLKQDSNYEATGSYKDGNFYINEKQL